MYIEDWDSFAQQAEALFRSEPLRTRYVLKYQHAKGKLSLKVTDDVTVRACRNVPLLRILDSKRAELGSCCSACSLPLIKQQISERLSV